MEVHILKTKQRLLSVFYRHFYNFTEKIYNKINQNLSLLDADAIHTKSKVVRIQQVRIKFSISHIWNINVKRWQRFDIWPLLIVSQEWKKKKKTIARIEKPAYLREYTCFLLNIFIGFYPWTCLILQCL